MGMLTVSESGGYPASVAVSGPDGVMLYFPS